MAVSYLWVNVPRGLTTAIPLCIVSLCQRADSIVQILRDYINSLPAESRATFAERCGTSLGYLRKAVSVGSTLGPELCAAIEAASNGEVRRWHLRPADWPLIWPELVGRPGAPAVHRKVHKKAPTSVEA